MVGESKNAEKVWLYSEKNIIFIRKPDAENRNAE